VEEFFFMADKRIVVWIQRFHDRPHLVLQWNDPETGKRKSQSAKTADEKQAEIARADLEADLNAGRYQEASRMSWERFRELFEAESVATRRPNTRQLYRDTLNLFEGLCHPTSLKGVTERTVSAFVRGMLNAKIKNRLGYLPSSIKTFLQFLHTALMWAAHQKLIPECPKFPTVKVPKKKPSSVPAESFEKLVAKAEDEQMQTYLLCGWLGGLRLSEAIELEWEPTDKLPWVDFTRDRIWLPAEFAKSSEDQWVPLDPSLKEALLRMPRQGRKVFRFISARTGKPISPKAMSQRVCVLAKKAGVRMTMHTLRKGFGCRYAGKVPAQVLQRLMRHANIKTTMDYYANVDVAVKEAVLGPQRNGLRNTSPTPANVPSSAAPVITDEPRS
jgi:integrase